MGARYRVDAHSRGREESYEDTTRTVTGGARAMRWDGGGAGRKSEPWFPGVVIDRSVRLLTPT